MAVLRQSSWWCLGGQFKCVAIAAVNAHCQLARMMQYDAALGRLPLRRTLPRPTHTRHLHRPSLPGVRTACSRASTITHIYTCRTYIRTYGTYIHTHVQHVRHSPSSSASAPPPDSRTASCSTCVRSSQCVQSCKRAAPCADTCSRPALCTPCRRMHATIIYQQRRLCEQPTCATARSQPPATAPPGVG